MKGLISTIGRIVYALPFAVFGIFHLMSAGQMAGMVPAWIPGGVFWVYLTGCAMIVAAAAIIFKREAKLACYGIAALMGVFILTVHVPGLAAGNQMSMISLLKDMSLGGAALAFSAMLSTKK